MHSLSNINNDIINPDFTGYTFQLLSTSGNMFVFVSASPHPEA
jgi:hypothetical protein